MARRSSGRSAPRPARAARAARPALAALAARPALAARAPRPARDARAPAPVQNRSEGSMVGSIFSGMAFGIGSAIAHRAVDAVMGPRVIQHETVAAPAPAPAAIQHETVAAPAPAPAAAAAPPTTNSFGNADACSVQSKAFQDCLNSSENDISKCQFYMDMLSECKRNAMLNA